jgi:phospholipase/carboxylesterase
MLSDVVVDPPNGQRPEQVIIFFHGYGSSGASMAQHVGNLLAPHLQSAKLYCPDGPILLGTDSEGRSYHSWFDVSDVLDNPDCDVVAPRARSAALAAQQYIDDVIRREGISEDRVIIAGFSQGGTMAFYSGLLRTTEVGGVYCLSGGALDRLTDPVSKPPVGLLAGGQEHQDYSGYPMAERTRAQLDAQGFRVDCAVLGGQGHDISPESVKLLAQLTHFLTPKEPRPPVQPEKENKNKGLKRPSP